MSWPDPNASPDSASAAPLPTGCAILLGASNLTLAWPRLIGLVRARFSDPIQVYTAHGMGRSYLLERTGFAVGKYPGILRCGIWDALPDVGDTIVPYVLITDLGNDLVYGCEPAAVAAAAEESIQRLRSWNSRCRIVVTGPPLESVCRLGWLRFLMFRSVLFPHSRLTLACVRQQTLELDERIALLAEQYSLRLIRPRLEWYGLDPIHVRRGHQVRAFSEMLAAWETPVREERVVADGLTSRPTAQLRWVLGAERQTQQPSTSGDGMSVFAY